MLEHYYIRPDTIDRIRASWIAGAIERYVDWLTEHRYAPRNVFRRVPVLRDFGDFARAHLAFGTPTITVRVADPPPGEAA